MNVVGISEGTVAKSAGTTDFLAHVSRNAAILREVGSRLTR
jgi:hypothetical protein